MIYVFKNKKPKIHASAFVAPNASVIGRVEIGAGSSVWFGAVLRGDINRIVIGKGTNIQDNCVLHVESDRACVLKDGVIMGHQATAHACTIEDGALIGIGARILNRAVVGKFSIIGAGAIVLENSNVPPFSLAVGVPAKVVRKLTAKEVAKSRHWAVKYQKLGEWYREHAQPPHYSAGLTPLDDLSSVF